LSGSLTTYRQIILGLLRLKTEFIAGQPQAYRQQKKGGIIVSSSKIRTTTYLPEDLYEQLRKEAYETKTSQAEIIEKALKEYFDKSEKNK
jgi:hypothetical protein